MEANFARALISPPQPRIIGVRMRPFALGHKLLLTQIDSAFVTRDRVPMFDDLIASAFICAHTWEENQKLIRSTFKRWLTLKVWGLLAGKFDIPQAQVDMMAYVLSGDDFPETEPPDNDQSVRELAAPPSARVYVFLRGLGLTDSEAMNMPCTAANWMMAAKLEEDGKITLLSRRRRAFLEMARQENERAAREEKEKAA